MNFWTKFGYLLIILNYEYVETGISGNDYHAMPLGHTGLLIFWDPKGAFDFETLYLKYHAVGKNTTSNISETALAKHGQYKLNSSLIENTEYEITIEDRYSKTRLMQIIKAKTGLKKNSIPEKPDFTWNLFRKMDVEYAELFIRIAWIPCGKRRNCHGNEAGTHFAVRYKIRDLRKTFTLVQNTTDYVDIPYIYMGHIHEVTVSSINGDFQTDSDSQEIFHVPSCGPVHSVNVLTLSNTSIYVSWNKPRQSIANVYLYFMYISTANKSPYLIKRLSEPTFNEELKIRRRLNGLTPNTNFTISIVPYSLDEYRMPGSAYTFDYMIPAIQAINTTRAKPVFGLEFALDGNVRKYYVNWIPCGETNDCKNMSPGSAFEVKIQNGNDEPNTVLEKVEHRTLIDVPCKYNMSRITVQSVNEFNQSSPSVSKTISCEHYYWRTI